MWFYSGRMASSNCQKRLYWYAARFICANIVIVRRPAKNNHKFRLKMSLYSIFIQQTRAHNAISFENYNAVNSNFFLFRSFRSFFGGFCQQRDLWTRSQAMQNQHKSESWWFSHLCAKKYSFVSAIYVDVWHGSFFWNCELCSC